MKRRMLAILVTLFVIGCAGAAFAGEMPADTKGIPYIEYYADLMGKDPADIDLSKAVCLTYSWQECEFAYPMQYIRDEESILSAAEFFRGISVTGEPDGIFSTEGGQGLSLQDEEGHTIISIFIQAGMIDSADGRREAQGLSGIRNIPGLMTPADWEEYYAKQQEVEETYRKTHQLNYPCTLFEAEGKEAFDFYEGCTAEEIDSIYFFHNGKNEYVTDRDAIQKIYDGLCKVQVTGPGEASRWADQWSVTLFYTQEGKSFSSEIHLSFREAALSAGDQGFALEDLEELFASYDWDEFAAIAEIIDQK